MFTIIYRTGGTASFAWNATLTTGSREELAAKAAEVERMGYRAVIVPARTPLPTTWEAEPSRAERFLAINRVPNGSAMRMTDGWASIKW